MTTVHTVAELRRALAPHRHQKTIALVPTMGALHSGHVALFETARRSADVVVASIFVNPSQFGDPADLARYPRTEAQDQRLAVSAGVDVCFAPSASELYPEGFATWVHVDGPARDLEGAHRPGHFRGVATICTKLFNIVAPQIAFFGQKDAQQVAVIRRLVRDLNLDLEIRVVPTVRDHDGLALSSRNAYLSAEQRAAAPTLYRVLKDCAAMIKAGETIDAVLADGRNVIARAGFALDYLEARHALTLEPIGTVKDGPVRVLVAAKLGTTRLIDNVAV
jgi:pantoate--beta-alanine ligase